MEERVFNKKRKNRKFASLWNPIPLYLASGSEVVMDSGCVRTDRCFPPPGKLEIS